MKGIKTNQNNILEALNRIHEYAIENKWDYKIY